MFFEAKELSHIKSENSMTGKDIKTSSEGSNHLELKVWLRNDGASFGNDAR